MPIMTSHAHVIIALPAPKEVSLLWDLRERKREREREKEKMKIADSNNLSCRVRR